MEFDPFFLLYILIAVGSAIYLFVKYRYTYWQNKGIPSLEGTFPAGNVKRNSPFFETFAQFYKEKNKGPLIGGYFFVRPVAVITSLDLINHILIKDFLVFPDRGTYYNEKDDPLSANLLTLDSDKWRPLRKKLSSTFTSIKMKFMFSTIVDVADKFKETFSKVLKTEKDINVKDLLARFTTDVIGTCAFGIDCNSLKDPNAEFRVYGQKSFSQPRDGILGRILKTQFSSLARRLRLKVISDDVSEFFIKVVKETVEYREKNKIKRNDFMDLLIDMKNDQAVDDKGEKLDSITLEEIAAQAFLFFLAGFETSSTTLSFSLYELALNQDIQEKARKEVNDVLVKHGGIFTYEAMMEMTFIDHIISETLRKYPPLVANLRTSSKDYKVPNTNFVLDKGTLVLIPVYAIHHDPEIYEKPEVFNPDRFKPEEVQKRHSMSFLAFGEGPRNCIGSRFGRMQSRIGLATLVKNFKFFNGKTNVPLVFSKVSPILAPEDGMWLRAEKV